MHRDREIVRNSHRDKEREEGRQTERQSSLAGREQSE